MIELRGKAVADAHKAIFTRKSCSSWRLCNYYGSITRW